MSKNFCEGCYTQRCILAHNSPKRMKICPCQICLIKMTCIEQCDKYKNLVVGLYPTVYSDYKKVKIVEIVFATSLLENYPYGGPTPTHKGFLALGSKVNYIDTESSTVYFRPNKVVGDVYFDP